MRNGTHGIVVLSGFVLVLLLSNCKPQSRVIVPTNMSLTGSDGKNREVAKIVSQNKLTVFIFDSDGCPTMAAHDERISSWAKRFLDRGVRFYRIESERLERGVVASKQSRPSHELLTYYADHSAQLAQLLGIEFATHSVVFDANGEIVYSGALDSDRVVLHADARMYLEETLEDLLANRKPRYGSPEPLGCVLQLH